MQTPRFPTRRPAKKAAGPGDDLLIVPRDLAIKARGLGHEALVQSISHALQFVDEPEEALRSLVYQIQFHAEYDPMLSESELRMAAGGS